MFSFLLFFLSGISLAQSNGPACQFSDEGPTPVVFFGGNASTPQQTRAWAAAAQASPTYGPHFRFEGHALGTANSPEQILHGMRYHIRGCIERIQTARGPVILVGHSNGSFVINEIVMRSSPEARRKIRLVNLDGPMPSVGRNFEGVEVQCWTAVATDPQNPAPNSCAEMRRGLSPFAASMARCGINNCYVQPVTGCRGPWCLHFRVINDGAPADVSQSNYDRTGYQNLEPHLVFLDRYLPR